MFGKEFVGKMIAGNNLETMQLDLQNSPKGIYLLTVQTGEKSYFKKLKLD